MAISEDVERLYSVLTARIHIYLHLARYARFTTICAAAKAVAILYNMVMELRQGEYLARQWWELTAALAGDLWKVHGKGCPVGAAAGADAPWSGERGAAGYGAIAS